MESILQRLAELDEIISALLIGKDGLIVAGALQNDDEEMLSALSATAFSSTAEFAQQITHSAMHYALIETEKGTIQFADVGDLILVVLTNGIGNLGRVRTEMKKTCQLLNELVAAY
jgi:predicted regulator of Ras-like GTPase activity (Roadblock/LC7/MglB family)